MPVDVLEREEPLAALHRGGGGRSCSSSARRGSARSSLVRAFADADARAGAADRLRRPARAAHARPAARRARGRRDPFIALMEELAGGTDRGDRGRPLGRRRDARRARLRGAADRDGRRGSRADLPRRGAPVAAAPARAWSASAPHVRIALEPLSRAAVDALAGGDGRGAAQGHGRQPVLRHRGARRAARGECPRASPTPCSPASAGSARLPRRARPALGRAVGDRPRTGSIWRRWPRPRRRA